MIKRLLFLPLLFCIGSLYAQQLNESELWHGKQRSMHYYPQGNDFVCTNGKMRFNRALYGTNTAFRVEAGDLPEFALYMPGMGGNIKFGLIKGNQSKWLIDANQIKAISRAGSMIYEIKDSLLGNGSIQLTVLALASSEGIVIKILGNNIAKDLELMVAYGGASGKKFSRDGDIGADPESSFYLKPEYCKDNTYAIDANTFQLSYGTGKVQTEEERYEVNHLNKQTDSGVAKKNPAKLLTGVFPSSCTLHIADANLQSSPIALLQSQLSAAPVVVGKMNASNEANYFLIYNPATTNNKNIVAANEFELAEQARKQLANRISIETPDVYINTLGSALAMASDAIWEDPSYLHGAVAWRMRLNAWRGAYTADPLGWHDRAKKHFSSYALSQVTTAPTMGVVADTALHLARQLEKIGTALFSDGYICRNPNGDIRAHHYDMNLVFIDQLLNHFNWTGDTAFVKQMFPLLKRHLAWEKRNFDVDGDGLYDAYAAIWASDALQYSGGGVTHSSAYNYKANKLVAELAKLIGEDGMVYEKEANHILSAINQQLWIKDKGWYAEYKDALGLKLLHPSAGLWTIYHAIDSKLPNAFQAYQSLQYIDNHIPHIPVKANGLNEKGLYVLATTNWHPYTWSLNNVALAENQHTALAYWQGNRPDAAYNLWRSTLIESMYMSASPGGFEQLSFYDAVRGELYRDFADPVGMVSRTLVEGLFGIQPNVLHNELIIQPGFPMDWNKAKLSTPDLQFSFAKNGLIDNYTIEQSFKKNLSLTLKLRARLDGIEYILVNGKPAGFTLVDDAIAVPMIAIQAPAANTYHIEIKWKGLAFEQPVYKPFYSKGDKIAVSFNRATIVQLQDPQSGFTVFNQSAKQMGLTANTSDSKTTFVQVKQGDFIYWLPLSFVGISEDRKALYIADFKAKKYKVDLTKYFNAKVTDIFKQQYLSPRVTSPTLQLPTQGIGNWCYPLTQANIDDAGLRKLAGTKNEIVSPDNIPFATPSDTLANNILFTSQWDNYPKQTAIPLNGKAVGIHMLMAGSTNAMQSRLDNGQVLVTYTDGTKDSLQLRNPDNWYPIEQDYQEDGYAFHIKASKLMRLYLKEGKFGYELEKYSTIKGFSTRAIDGGAATILFMRLDNKKQLKSLTLKTFANDVVIGLMAATLVR